MTRDQKARRRRLSQERKARTTDSLGFRRTSRKPLRDTLSDLTQGFARTGDAWRAARRDIALSYQRTMFGPFWITISTAVFVFGYSLLGTFIFKQSIETYLPFLVSGVVLWQYMTSSLNASISIFGGQLSLLTASRLPITFLFLRFSFRTFIQFAHSLPVVLIIVLIFADQPIQWFSAALGLLIVFVTISMLCLLIGTLSVWMHDLGVIVANLTQFMFYMSPVMWLPELVLKSDGWFIVAFNPFHYMLRVFREPLRGQALTPVDYIGALTVLGIATVLALIVYVQKRRHIAYAI